MYEYFGIGKHLKNICNQPEEKSGAQRGLLSENVTIPEVFWPATVDFCFINETKPLLL